MKLNLAVSAYVLAGGRSSRMGHDKALLRLGGRMLVEHAVTKLSRITPDVSLLAGAAPGNPDLAAYGRRVFDVHPGTGPIGGIEAALADTRHDWNLIYPVDAPMVPSALLAGWVAGVLAESGNRPLRIAMFVDDGVPQPALLMIHRGMLSCVRESIGEGKLKLFPALQWAAGQIAHRLGVETEELMRQDSLDACVEKLRGSAAWSVDFSEEQRADVRSWFVNLNTREDFAWAEEHPGLLDT